MKMQTAYAQRILDGGYAFGNRFLSKTDDLLVCEDLETGSLTSDYYGTKLKDGQLQTDGDGYVVFQRIKPIIDKHTRWKI